VSERQQRFKGGIGMRGPGESPLQMRNAPMKRRIRHLKEKLEAEQRRRETTRNRRPWPVLALVGYTNAGKSTLLNTLASADAYVDDRLFATLDTKSRLLRLPTGRDVLLTDTVGFIRHLPHGLVASFRSTLDEVRKADLLLHVADASHRHVLDHCAVVTETLAEIGASHVPSLLLLNKCDTPEAQAALPDLYRQLPVALAISAHSGYGLPTLHERIAAMLADSRPDPRYPLPDAAVSPE
jgi:GTPase